MSKRVRQPVSTFWRKLKIAVGGLLLTEVAARVVAPSIDSHVLAEYVRQYGTRLLGLYDRLGGGAMSRGAVLGLGIMPYLSASIIMRLARIAIPGVAERWDTHAGRTQIKWWTRYLTTGLAAIQAIGFTRFVQNVPGAVANPGVGFTVETVVMLTAGSIFAMLLAEQFMAPDADEPDPEEEAADQALLGAASPDFQQAQRRGAESAEVRRETQ